MGGKIWQLLTDIWTVTDRMAFGHLPEHPESHQIRRQTQHGEAVCQGRGHLMDKVLVDGSTVVFVARLLSGEDDPSAINLFDLAVLTESLILHDEVIVLATAERGTAPEVDEAAAQFGPSVHVEHRKVGDLLWEYVQGNGYDTDGHAPVSPPNSGEALRLAVDSARWLWKTFASQRPGDTGTSATSEPTEPKMTPAPYGMARDMYGDLFLEQVDSAYRRDLDEYAVILEDVYKHAAVEVPVGHVHRALRRMVGAPPRSVNPADRFMTGPEVRVGYDSLPAYEDPGLWDRSPFQEDLTRQQFSERSFWEGVVIRAHLYLIASSLFGAPYKADSLRWPICWKFFGAGDLSQIAVDENYVRLAEDFERKRIESFNEFVGRPAILARLPLFLRTVLARSAGPGDIVEQTLTIRNSKAATRFREHMRELTTSLSDGEIAPVLRGVAVLGAALSKEYGVDRNEVIWSLLSAGTKMAAEGVTPAAGVDLAQQAAKGVKGLAAWQRQRKFALISKALHQTEQAKTLEQQVIQVFGTGLKAWDLELLDRLQAYGRSH